ncbi:MAG: hypothetical protein ACRD9L_05200, partial [Bryobacteraceae bacterium]
MEPTTESAGPPAQGSYVWEPPGNPVSIHISFDVVDGIAKEVLRAFSSVPRRGAEAGGLLLGRAERGERLVVRIRSFEPVPCEHRFGPSYLLSDADRRTLEAAFRSHANVANGEDRVVGYFRSHTRDGFALGPEDLALCRDLFSDPAHVVLLIKPFATKVSTAGFLFHENGKFQTEPYKPFPFRRRDLNGGQPAREPAPDATPEPAVARPARARVIREEIELLREPERAAAAESQLVPAPSTARLPEPGPGKTKAGGKRLWISLSLVLVAIGVLLGWEAAHRMNPRPQIAASPANFSLGLAITTLDDNLR